jgi:hypothetical protein
VNLAEAAARNAVLKTLLDRVKAAYEQSRKDVDAAMREVGAERVSASLPSGVKVAQIVLTQPKPAVVLDEDAFLDWCEANWPDEIVTVRRVRSSFQTAMLSRLAIVGERAVDTATGEAVEWAHVRAAGEPYPTTKLVEGGKAAIETAWRDGEISLDALTMPEIER